VQIALYLLSRVLIAAVRLLAKLQALVPPSLPY